MKTQCSHCQQVFEIDDLYFKQSVECQSCGLEFIVEPYNEVVKEPQQAASLKSEKPLEVEPEYKNCPMCGEKILAVAKNVSIAAQ